MQTFQLLQRLCSLDPNKKMLLLIGFLFLWLSYVIMHLSLDGRLVRGPSFTFVCDISKGISACRRFEWVTWMDKGRKKARST